MYFVNWQRDISVEERDGHKVVVKRNKPTKGFHEFIITYTYSLISLLLVHPSSPASPEEIIANEGRAMRNNLARIGVFTPELIAISDQSVVEEYIEGGDLYNALQLNGMPEIAFGAGVLTGKVHNADYSFVDNKAQNYLVRETHLVRTDLGFTKRTSSKFARSMDIGSFLASTIDLPRYSEIEQAFLHGYFSETGRKFSYLAIIIRNLLSLGFSSDSAIAFKNMILDSRPLLEF